jgi:hypothetical protein
LAIASGLGTMRAIVSTARTQSQYCSRLIAIVARSDAFACHSRFDKTALPHAAADDSRHLQRYAAAPCRDDARRAHRNAREAAPRATRQRTELLVERRAVWKKCCKIF